MPISMWVMVALLFVQSRIHGAQIEDPLSSITASFITIVVIIIIVVSNEQDKKESDTTR